MWIDNRRPNAHKRADGGDLTATLMLPNESHGYRARESIMHMLYETNVWLDKYVKNATPSGQSRLPCRTWPPPRLW